MRKRLFLLVPEEGLEPSRGFPHRILSPARLPFHHSGTKSYIDNEGRPGMQERESLTQLSVKPQHRLVQLMASFPPPIAVEASSGNLS